MILSPCNAFHMHIMTYRSHREKKIRAACILGTAKMKLTSYCGGCIGDVGGGYWFKMF